jgi:hypothetical protein
MHTLCTGTYGVLGRDLFFVKYSANVSQTTQCYFPFESNLYSHGRKTSILNKIDEVPRTLHCNAFC